MEIRFEQPAWLWLLAGMVPLALAGAWWFSSMSVPRRMAAVAARGMLVALVAGMLAGASMVRRTSTLAVVAVVDVSESVRRYGKLASGRDPVETAREFLARNAGKRGPEDLLGVVVFDGSSAVVATPTRGDLGDRSLDARMRSGTNLEEAIRLARTLIPPDAAGRLLVISDGVETSGNARKAAAEAAGTARRGALGVGIPIDVAPVRYAVKDEVVVESVDVPPTAAAESTVTVRVTLRSTSGSRGTLRLLREGRAERIGEAGDGLGRRLELNPGTRVESVEVRLDAGRVHRFRAVWEPDAVERGDGTQGWSGDTLAENNAAEGVTITPGRGAVLVVTGEERGKDTLAEALRTQRMEVEVVGAEGFPRDLLSLQSYDLVVFENVGAEALSPEQHRQVAAYVKELSGGFLMVGGPDSFGAGGWKGTALEEILPVKLDIPEEIVSPESATLFVIDNSGSMSWSAGGSGRSKQEVANQATALAISRMDRSDLVGVMTFNNRYEVVIPLHQNKDAEASAERVRSIGTGGGTVMIPALTEAFEIMKRAEVKDRHIIVVSDGRSMGRDALPGLAAEIGAAGIRVSTIGVGDDADGECMEAMAKNGNGTFYMVLNPNVLPKVFLKAVRLRRSPLVRESPFQPVVLPTGSPLWSGLGTPPVLNGLVLTRPREEPTITLALVTPGGEPVLAHWNVALGRVGAFTSDASRWAEPWLSWPGYSTFWVQAARQLSRASGGRSFQGSSEQRGGEMRVRVDAVGEDGKPMDFLEMSGTAYGPSGEGMAVRLTQTGPGVYEGVAPAREVGTYVTVVRPTQGGKALAPVVLGATAPASEELRSLTSNEGLLEDLARTTGGRVLDLEGTDPVRLFERAGLSPQEAMTGLWRLLMWWAIVMFVVDVGMRRVAWDRWVSREFGGEVVAGARAALADRSARAAGATAGLRERMAQGSGMEPTAALGEEDARRLAEAARDRRRAARIREVEEGSRASEVAPEPPKDEGGLMAAKRRAARRFEEDQA